MKTKILIIGDSAAVHSGFAKVIRETFIPLHETGEYEIQQVGWFHYGTFEEVPWKIYHTKMGNGPNGPAPLKDDAHGEVTGRDVCKEFKPDIVWTCADPWMLEHLPNMRTEFGFKWVAQVFIDGGPLLEKHSEVWNSADALVPVTSYGYDIMNAMTTLNKEILRPPIYCGVNRKNYRRFSKDEKDLVRNGIIESSQYLSSMKDPIILGYVGRNQRRKLLPCFFVLNAMMRSGKTGWCKECKVVTAPKVDYEWQVTKGDRYVAQPCHCCGKSTQPHKLPEFAFWLHTPPGDRGWNLKELEIAYDIQDQIARTVGHQILKGISENEFARVFNTFDVYLSFATEGFGLPILEALSCGVPVVTPAFAASYEFTKELGWNWIPESVILEDGSSIPRPLPDYNSVLNQLIKFGDRDYRMAAAQKSFEYAKKYTWDEPAAQWNQLLKQVADAPKQQPGMYLY